jgi:hypothetical protein
MTTADTHLIEVAKRYATLSIQVSKAYDAEQSKLDLDATLSYDRLSSSAGTQESLGAIERLAVLTEKHKAAVEKVFLACATDLTQALSELPEEKRAEYRDGILKTLHGQLAAQSLFYESRGKWIEAARGICRLIEDQRETARFVGETVVFAEDAENGRFEELMDAVEDAHKVEMEHMKQLLERFSQSATFLGLHPQ